MEEWPGFNCIPRTHSQKNLALSQQSFFTVLLHVIAFEPYRHFILTSLSTHWSLFTYPSMLAQRYGKDELIPGPFCSTVTSYQHCFAWAFLYALRALPSILFAYEIVRIWSKGSWYLSILITDVECAISEDFFPVMARFFTTLESLLLHASELRSTWSTFHNFFDHSHFTVLLFSQTGSWKKLRTDECLFL